MAPFVAAYDDLLKGEFAKYLELSNKIGGDVQTQVMYTTTIKFHVYPLSAKKNTRADDNIFSFLIFQRK